MAIVVFCVYMQQYILLLSPDPTRPNILPIVYVIVSVEKKSVSSI